MSDPSRGLDNNKVSCAAETATVFMMYLIIRPSPLQYSTTRGECLGSKQDLQMSLDLPVKMQAEESPFSHFLAYYGVE